MKNLKIKESEFTLLEDKTKDTIVPKGHSIEMIVTPEQLSQLFILYGILR